MSSYATLSDLTTFGIPAASLAGISNLILQAHLDAASNLIDSYIGAKFVLPLVTWNTAITMKVVQIAEYTLLVTRGFDPENSPDKEVLMAYDQAIKWCEGISNGEITPIVADSNPQPGQYGGPNTLQMNTSQPSTQSRQDGTVESTLDGSSNTQNVGPPRQRGWR